MKNSKGTFFFFMCPWFSFFLITRYLSNKVDYAPIPWWSFPCFFVIVRFFLNIFWMDKGLFRRRGKWFAWISQKCLHTLRPLRLLGLFGSDWSTGDWTLKVEPGILKLRIFPPWGFSFKCHYLDRLSMFKSIWGGPLQYCIHSCRSVYSFPMSRDGNT